MEPLPLPLVALAAEREWQISDTFMHMAHTSIHQPCGAKKIKIQ